MTSEERIPLRERIFSDCSRTLRMSASTSVLMGTPSTSRIVSARTRKSGSSCSQARTRALVSPCTRIFTRPSGSFNTRITMATVPVW